MAAHEAGVVGNRGHFFRAILVAALRSDRFARFERHRQLRRAHVRGDIAFCPQMHFDAARVRVEARDVFERIASEHETWVIEMFSDLKLPERKTLYDLLGQLRVNMAARQNQSEEVA